MERRYLPVALLAAAAGAAITQPRTAVAQTVTHGALLGPPLILTGTGTYTPSAGASAIYVVLIGGGGGSGGAQFTSRGSASGGAGGGGICAKYITPLSGSYTFIGGFGGQGGLAGSGGSHGSQTRFWDDTGTVQLHAPGGVESSAAADGSPLAPGAPVGNVASGGDLNLPSSAGYPGFAISGSFQSGSGGGNAYGVGGSGSGALAQSGYGFGAGASGAVASTASQPGASGTNGAIIVWEYS